MDFIFVIRFNEGKNRLLTTPFEVLDDDPGIIADSLIANRFCNVVRNRDPYQENEIICTARVSHMSYRRRPKWGDLLTLIQHTLPSILPGQ